MFDMTHSISQKQSSLVGDRAPTEEVRCTLCGYIAMYLSDDNKGKIRADTLEMSATCGNFGSGKKGLQYEHFGNKFFDPDTFDNAGAVR